MSIYETHPDLVAKFDSVMDELDTTDSRKQELDCAQRLIRLAERLVDAAPDDADAYQMLGLAWYGFPRHSSWRSWHCRAALDKALALAPDHAWVHKTLGYLLFDQERYRDALHHLSKVDRSIFESPQFEWELLKVQELCLVCQLRLSPSTLPADFATFCTAYLAAKAREDEAIELGSTEPLHELPECAEWLLEQGAESQETPLREILAFLYRFRSEVSFWNPAYAAALEDAQEDAVKQGFATDC
ncbi:MAG: hypothetical protein AAF560_27680 [Acidobacteriota bacterium]